MHRSFVVIQLFTALFLLTTTAFAVSLETVQFIKISAQDSKAVIWTAGSKMQVVKPGDTIAENTTIKEIISERIILEEKTERGMETIIVRMDDGLTRIERLHK